MIQRDRIADIEHMTVREFTDALQRTAVNLDDGIKAGHAIELVAVALNIEHLGQDLRDSLERWLQLDLWEGIRDDETTGNPDP